MAYSHTLACEENLHKKKSEVEDKSRDIGDQFTSPANAINVYRRIVAYVIGIQIIQFRPKYVINHRPIVLAIDSDGLADIVLKDIQNLYQIASFAGCRESNVNWILFRIFTDSEHLL